MKFEVNLWVLPPDKPHRLVLLIQIIPIAAATLLLDLASSKTHQQTPHTFLSTLHLTDSKCIE